MLKISVLPPPLPQPIPRSKSLPQLDHLTFAKFEAPRWYAQSHSDMHCISLRHDLHYARASAPQVDAVLDVFKDGSIITSVRLALFSCG